jgi:hypothetical protein
MGWHRAANLLPARREEDVVDRADSSPTMRPLSIQRLHSLRKFLIKVADHVIKGDVSLAFGLFGLKVFLMLLEPRVDLITHLDRLHTPPLLLPRI